MRRAVWKALEWSQNEWTCSEKQLKGRDEWYDRSGLFGCNLPDHNFLTLTSIIKRTWIYFWYINLINEKKSREVVPNNDLLLRQQVIVCSQIQPRKKERERATEGERSEEKKEKATEGFSELKTKTKPEHGSHWQDKRGRSGVSGHQQMRRKPLVEILKPCS